MFLRTLGQTIAGSPAVFNKFAKCFYPQSVRSFHQMVESVSIPAADQVVTLIPGDGIYPQLIEQVKIVFNEMQVPIIFKECPISEVNPENKMSVNEVADCIRETKVCLKGVISTPLDGAELRSYNMKLRRNLDMFANVVRVRSLRGLSTRHNNLDFVIIREQTEGEYSSLEHESVPGVIECLKIVTRTKSQYIAKFAFDFALRNDRKKVTAVHKANIMKLGDGLFLECAREVAALYPQIHYDEMIVDNACMQLVANPYQFDVLVMPNLYGSIIDNVACGLVGGAGLVPAESYSHDVAVFEPAARHTFVSNPTAMLLSAVSMLKHMNLHFYASKLEEAVKLVIRRGNVKTPDIGGRATCEQFTEAVVKELRAHE